MEPVPENRSSIRSFLGPWGTDVRIAFEDVETEIGGVLGLERGGEGARDERTFSQRWLRERPRDSSDDSSPFNGFVSDEGEGEFTRLFP